MLGHAVASSSTSSGACGSEFWAPYQRRGLVADLASLLEHWGEPLHVALLRSCLGDARSMADAELWAPAAFARLLPSAGLPELPRHAATWRAILRDFEWHSQRQRTSPADTLEVFSALGRHLCVLLRELAEGRSELMQVAPGVCFPTSLPRDMRSSAAPLWSSSDPAARRSAGWLRDFDPFFEAIADLLAAWSSEDVQRRLRRCFSEALYTYIYIYYTHK